MRICMIMSTPLPPSEGIGFYVWNLSRYLADFGHDVQIITRGGRGEPGHEIVKGITIWRPLFLPLYPFHVHLHSIFVDALLRRLMGDVDLVHLHTPLVKLPRTTTKTLVTVHTPMKTDTASVPVTTLLGLLVKLQTPISCHLERELFTHADKLVAVATSVVHELRFYNIESSKVAVLANGIDTMTFRPSLNNSIKRGSYFLTAARLAPRKGLEDLVSCAEQVVHQFPDYRFFIAGAGPWEKDLRKRIALRGLQDRVILLGHIYNRDTLVELYRGAAAYVHPAHYEGLPTALLEAMACGCPVVATAVSGALDVVEHEQNGLLVPAKAPEQMAGAVTRLLWNPDLARQMGGAAARTVKERYSWNVVSRNYLAQYESLLNGVQR